MQLSLPGLGAAPLPSAISRINSDFLLVGCPHTPRQVLVPFVPYLQRTCVEFRINNIRRVCAFVANMIVECQGFTRMEENLSYSAARLMKVWPRRFPNIGIAQRYAFNPQKLANNVYANRMGNGNEASGDGWKFRGSGGMDLTGRDNYTEFAKFLGCTVEEASAYVRTTEGAMRSAGWFWDHNDVNRLADTPGVKDEVEKINGGLTGLADRRELFDALVEYQLRHQ